MMRLSTLRPENTDQTVLFGIIGAIIGTALMERIVMLILLLILAAQTLVTDTNKTPDIF